MSTEIMDRRFKLVHTPRPRGQDQRRKPWHAEGKEDVIYSLEEYLPLLA